MLGRSVRRFQDSVSCIPDGCGVEHLATVSLLLYGTREKHFRKLESLFARVRHRVSLAAGRCSGGKQLHRLLQACAL